MAKLESAHFFKVEPDKITVCKTIHTSLIDGFERGTYETQGHIDQALTNLIVVHIPNAYLYTLN